MKKVKPNIKFQNSRKILRRDKRKQKKINRKDYYLRQGNGTLPNESPGKFVKRLADTQVIEKDVKHKKQKIETTQDILLRQLKKEKSEANKLKSQMNDQRKKMMLEANEEEDKMIKKLEKQLGLNKSKNKNNYFTDDGLDYLLEICDRTTSEQIVAAEKHLADVEHDEDFEEDLAVVTSKEMPSKQKKSKDEKKKTKSDAGDKDFNDIYDDNVNSDDDDKSVSDDNNVDGESVSNESSVIDDVSDNDSDGKSENCKKFKTQSKSINKIINEKIVSEEDLGKVFSEDEVSVLSGDDDDFSDNESGDDVDKSSEAIVKEKPDVWEDIYGRKRDKDGNIVKEEKGVYIPPHLRNKDSASDKELAQLKRHIKSVLNKLAGTNLHWACNSVESLYSSNSRNAVNTSLSQLWFEALIGNAFTPDRMVAEHAALIAVLHANVGSEVGAHFLEKMAQRFDSLMEVPQPVDDKTLDNLVACLSLLYSFKIYHGSLLYDILNRLVEDLSEKNIDCVLVALRNVGGVLRKEEPAALKTFIHDTQAKVVKMNQINENGSRVKYLQEMLLAVKNNNLNKLPNYDPTYVEDLKKLSRGIIRRGNYVTPLHIRLEDLLKAHERGKWWVVGSAWEGNRVQEDKQTDKQTPSTNHKLLELARKQRMNTDIRRSIFCVIMSAEDYMDAFEKLQHLGLKAQQEREVVHVLLACCLQEKTYNPYYAILGQKLCDYDRKYQLSVQYSIWDKIKELESLPKQNLTNLAQFLVHLIMEKGLSLSVLKIIQFSDLNKTTVKFMRQILLAIIMNADLQASLEVFHRISKPPKLHMFRESMRLFIQHFLIKNAGKKTSILTNEEMETLKERAVEVGRILTMYENKLRL